MPAKTHVTFYGVWPNIQEYVRKKMRLKNISCHLHTENITPKIIEPETNILAVFIETPVDKATLDKLPNLKMITTMSTGYDHIDIETAKARKIPVCNVPSYGENTVAEHAMGLILSLSRKLFPSVKRVKESKYSYQGLCGMDLKGKTLGIIGTGRIGINLIQMAKGFDMQVLAYDPYPNKEMAKKMNFQYTTLEKLLENSDVVSLHVPLLKDTYHIINKSRIKKMKKGAYLINTARGALIDPEALVWALESNYLAGAGLDVLEEEYFLQREETILTSHPTSKQIKTDLMNKIIIDHENTIVTPHNAFNSTEALQRIADTTIENIKNFLAGKIVNDVTKPKLKK